MLAAGNTVNKPIVVTDDAISSNGATYIHVVDLSGRTVASAQSNRLDIASLKGGVYVVKVNFSVGSQTLRFVRK